MKHLIVSSIFALTGLLGTVSSPQSPSPNNGIQNASSNVAADTVDVQHVIDAYHEAVVAHDGTRLASLFLAQGGMWLNVLSDEACASEGQESGRIEGPSRELCGFCKASFNSQGQLQSDPYQPATEQRRYHCLGLFRLRLPGGWERNKSRKRNVGSG